MTEDEILGDFPYLDREDIRAVLAFAVALGDRVPPALLGLGNGTV